MKVAGRCCNSPGRGQRNSHVPVRCERRDATDTRTLDDYRRHAELYGPELVVETAGHDLDEGDLTALRSYVGHLVRTKRWHRGRWHDTHVVARACQECGLDLPAGARADTRRHVYCRERAAKRRARARAKVSDTGPARPAGRPL